MDKAYESAINSFGPQGIQAATIGDPDIRPPQEALDIYARYAADPNKQGYQMPSFGDPELLKGVAAFRNRRLKINMGPRSVAAVKGARRGLGDALEAFTDEGELVAMPAMLYPGCLNGAVRAYCKPVFYSAMPDTHLPEEVEKCYEQAYHEYGKYPKVCVIVPVGNPVGTVLKKDPFQEVVEYLRHMDSRLISDEAYICNPFLGEETFSLMQIPHGPEVGVSISTFSKTYNVPSWRLAFFQGNEKDIENIARVGSSGEYGHHYGIQQAGLELLKEKYDNFATDCGEQYGQRYAVVAEVFARYGISVLPAKAGMFAAPVIPDVWARLGSLEVAARILEQTGKRVNAGIIHGQEADGILRVALVRSEEVLREISEGICKVLTSLPDESNVPADAITSYTA